MPRVQNPLPGPGQVTLFTTTTLLSQAQILALAATPVVLVAAPGVGKIINVMSVAIVTDAGTVAYKSSNDQLRIRYHGDASNDIIPQTSLFDLVTNASDLFTAAPSEAIFANVLPGDDNQQIELSAAATYNDGPIVTATLGAGGTGYVANDTGTITTGTGDATYQVLTVGALGAVLTFSVTAPGTRYTTGNLQATATGGAQPGVGVNFTVDITAVQTGNGTLKIVTYYQIVPVP